MTINGSILSIQSHVAYGYVGNRAAVFPLQHLGYDVIAVNTVQFSNHTGYGSWKGDVFPSDHVKDVLRGLLDRGCFENISGVLSGYLGDSTIGDIILETLDVIGTFNTDIIYCCDPVMGDVGRGLFVKDDVPLFYKENGIEKSTILTPNQFELNLLTGQTINTIDDARAACNMCHKLGPKIILLTSLETQDAPPDEIQMLLSLDNGECWSITTPKLQFDPAPNGSGDLTAALFLGYYLADKSPVTALEKTTSVIYNVFMKTQEAGQRELALIQSQQLFEHDIECQFKAVTL